MAGGIPGDIAGNIAALLLPGKNRILIQTHYYSPLIDLHDAANALKQMKNEMLFYKRAYEDTSQNALWQYMLEYFAAKYTELAKEMSGANVQIS